jgi:hypothetical protein
MAKQHITPRVMTDTLQFFRMTTSTPFGLMAMRVSSRDRGNFEISHHTVGR